MASTGDYDNETIQTPLDSGISLTRLSQNSSWRFEEHLPSDPDNCSKIVGELLSQLESSDWGNRDTFGIHMAVEEAVLNAIRHGNQSDPAKTFHVIIELSETSFYSKVTDQGSGFDPSAIPDPTLEENLEKTSGRGVMLMNSFVDEVIYNEIGNSVELKKKKSE